MATDVRPAALSRTKQVAALRIRERLEARELLELAPQATRSASARRDRDEDPAPTWTAFQVDRDRILHSKSFRRTKHKTQVFLAPVGDHYRTRLTHILEVTQIGRSIAMGIGLNESLVEAAALGHDLGHTPFGHVGEEVLATFLPEGFRHNQQSVRIVERLERGGHGLNLTREVRDAILKHSAPTGGGIETAAWGEPETPEGWIVRFADKIAYLHHDIDDAVRAGIIAESDLPKESRAALGETRGERLDTMVYDVIVSSIGKVVPTLSDDVLQATNELRRWMFDHVYLSGAAKTEDDKAQALLRELLAHFERHPERMPVEHQGIATAEGVKRAVADYVAGMTDGYAIDTYEAAFVPSAWSRR